MARIRTVKPELWTDERLTECSLSARLLFIGMLNFSDDNGNQAYSSKRLKMQIFPADSLDVAPLLNELLTHGLLIEYSVSKEKYLHIKGFKKHQVINRPSATSIPEPDISDYSRSTPTLLIDGREGKGKEGKEIPAQAPKTKKSTKTSLPNDFCVSDRVKNWAKEKKYENLDLHFNNFLSAAKRKGYTYADWDEALMEAIRKDWAKLGQSSAKPWEM